ncbi:unnamed protein product [Adineta steineri]|uniref:NAD(P)(+)--arginine ADP-ribosyltransferase n=1 Tax=Adineta steineri TaxID=433720 RepID=A0A816CL11_9BILA|nr:unnamed protein product [Adineta steineri]CAF1623068.1 unnamed protein product [Adineta steineri]
MRTSGSELNQTAAELSKSTTSSDIRQPRQRMALNYLLLWIDISIDQTNDDFENTVKQIQAVTGDVNVFRQREACIDFLTDAQEDIKCFLVVKDATSQQLMPLISDIPQLVGIYIFNDIKTPHEEWTKEWQKIKGVHTTVDDICQRLQMEVKQYNQDSIAVSFVSVNEIASTDNLNQLEPTFMYTQLFKKILLDMEHDEQAIKQFIAYCRNNNRLSPNNINSLSPKNTDRFEKEYHAQSAIWWYTYPSNIYYMLNDALRTLDADIIINMGFFLRDVHIQIRQLYEKQISNYDGKSFKVYRGQGLTKSDFEKLQQTKGGLMSFNNFLSTSTNKVVSLEFAECALTKADTVGILFIMSIDPCIKSTPFAYIKEMSATKSEEEILFSMHTVFRVGAIEQPDSDKELYEVELQLTSDDDQQLRVLTDRMQEEADGDTGWQRLGDLLLKIGQFNKAEELYNVLLEKTSDEGEKAIYYHQLGSVHSSQGDYEKAICYYEQGLEIQQKTLPSDHHDLAISNNSIGLVYYDMGKYSEALSYYEKAREIRQKTLPSDLLDLATLYNNIGCAYNNIGEYSKALPYHRKALKIREKFLPANHPKLAISHNNIGLVYANMGEYSKALSSHEKALEIYQKTLPSNHPSLATSYNNIGLMFNNMGDYSKALSSHEKALEIREKSLSSNHPHLACSYNNIGSVYDNIGEYSKALSYYEKAFEIQEKSLSSDHPDLAVSYGNIGLVYSMMEKYSEALSFHEKALEIQQKALPSNHPDLATSYSNIGLVYNNMGEHSKALSFHEKAFEIRQKTLPSNHPDLATSYNNIGTVYYNMEEHSKALSFLEKALEITQKALPSNHPDLACSYNNIARLCYNMTDYSNAFSYYDRALRILKRTLPPTHPHIRSVQGSIDVVKTKL